MAQYYRIEVQTSTSVGQSLALGAAAFSQTARKYEWTSDSNIVISADVDIQKSTGGRISSFEVVLWDKNWELATLLPDPAFQNIPMRLYLSPVGEGQKQARLVFDGTLTSIASTYPEDHLTLTAHDKTFAMRTAAKARTFANKTSVQLLQSIASEYGLSVDSSLIQSSDTTIRSVDFGISALGRALFTDWDHVRRALGADGLELIASGKTLQVRKAASLVYPVTFRRGDDGIISFSPIINHVSGSGAAGQVRVPLPGGNRGSQASANGGSAAAVESSASGADAATHRTVPQGAVTGQTGAHTESTGNYAKKGIQNRRRKDEATLVIRSDPFIGLQHLIAMAGWGGKFDGNWRIESIKHYVTGFAAATSSIRLNREPSGSSEKSLGILPGGTIT